MFIALTGTPGTGKTTIGLLLQAQGVTVIDLHTLANEEGMIEGIDKERNSDILDELKLADLIMNRFHRSNTIVFIGHISHLLTCMDWVIVLRCEPNILKQRLKMRNWNREKIRENLEAEIVDVILCEAVSQYGTSKVIEMNTTQTMPKVICSNIVELLTNKFSNTDTFQIGATDWTDYANEKFLTDV